LEFVLIISRKNFSGLVNMEDMAYFYPEGHAAHFETGHPERPERVEIIRTALQNAGMWEAFPKVSPIQITEELFQTVHSPEYLSLLEMTCRRAGHLDMDTYTTQASWDLARRAAGGAAAISASIWEGKSKRGFALTRPPGHHAMHGQGMGFCLLNNVAIAAEYMLSNYPLKRIAIVDLDLHHGNGTQDIFWSRDDVFYISTHQSPFYPGTGRVDEIGVGEGAGWTANFPLPPGSGDSAFLTIMDQLILPLLDQRMPQMILVSYGFDPHWMDPLGQLLLTADGYGKLIQKLCVWADNHCDGKIGLILEGGYELKAAEACSLAVVSAMLGKPWVDPFPCPYQPDNSWLYTVKRAQSVWHL
jgi:acetoin utilization deacetylase AcuC-like enzyme